MAFFNVSMSPLPRPGEERAVASHEVSQRCLVSTKISLEKATTEGFRIMEYVILLIQYGFQFLQGARIRSCLSTRMNGYKGTNGNRGWLQVA